MKRYEERELLVLLLRTAIRSNDDLTKSMMALFGAGFSMLRAINWANKHDNDAYYTDAELQTWMANIFAGHLEQISTEQCVDKVEDILDKIISPEMH